MPTYPTYPPWTNKSGRGVYELRINKEGKVEGVKILKPSGDETFDNITTQAMWKWRFARKPLVLEIPLGFNLTPTSYSVKIR